MLEATTQFNTSQIVWGGLPAQVGELQPITLPPARKPLTLAGLYLEFWRGYAREHWRDADGNMNRHAQCRRVIIRHLVRSMPGQLVAEMKPRDVTNGLVKLVRKGKSRRYINTHLTVLKHMMRWGCEHDLVPAEVAYAIRMMAPLRVGHFGVRENDRVKPATWEQVLAVRPYVTRSLWDAIQVHWHTGMRSGELLRMRPCDIDRSRYVWIYTPTRHKTAHHGVTRTIPIGPNAQKILEPIIRRIGDEEPMFGFGGYEAGIRITRDQLYVAIWDTSMSQVAKKLGTSLSVIKSICRRWHIPTPPPWHAVKRRYGDPVKRPPLPIVDVSRRNPYTPNGYLEAVRRACKRAGVRHWHPHMIRHAFAQRVREAAGIDVTQALLGHRTPQMTHHYAGQVRGPAIEAIARIG